MIWTREKITLATATLAKSRTVGEAVEYISKALGETVTAKSLAHALDRAAMKSPSFYIQNPHIGSSFADFMKEQQQAKPSKPRKIDRDPVEIAEENYEISRLKKNQDKLVEELRTARLRQSFLDELSATKAPPQIICREKNSGLREMTAVALASDWHVEEPVEPEKVAYRNEYNLEIADVRVQRFFEAIAWQIEHHRASGKIAVHDLVLWLGGDFFSGYIHEELIENVSLSPIESVRWIIPRLRNGINFLMNELNLAHLEIPCSPGNHSRSTKKTHISSTAENSYEWLMYHQLADEFCNEKQIHFELTKSRHQYVQVYNDILHFHHGDDVKYNGGVGGLGIPLLKRVPMWDLIKKATVHNIGHFHQCRDYGRAVTNGSLIGLNDYAQSLGIEFEEPKQAFYFMDSKRGKCQVTPLWVDEIAQS